MTRSGRADDLNILIRLAKHRAMLAKADLSAIDRQISEIRFQIEREKEITDKRPIDVVSARAADSWIRLRRTNVASLNALLARNLSDRAGAARASARATAVEEVLDVARQSRDSEAGRRDLRRLEERLCETPRPRE